MISLRTNLSSYITQSSMTNSTNKLNQAIERMSTGYKINHAGDNAANYSISKNMSVQLSACDIAADNIAMGIDLLQTAQDTIAGMQSRGSRLQALITQARNGTYGTDSLNAMTQEANAIMAEINRLYTSTEYNGMKIFDKIELPDWAQKVKSSAGTIDGVSLEQCAEDHHGFIMSVTQVEPEVVVDDPRDLEEAISSNNIIGIRDAETLAELAKIVNGTDGYQANSCSGKTIVLTEDIDLREVCGEIDGSRGWIPIGNATYAFDGTFDGNGHKVTGLYINRSDGDLQGLFGFASGTIKNLGVERAAVTGGKFTGALAGEAAGISNCYATGSVTGHDRAGGLVGGSGDLIASCYAAVSVQGGDEIGGLVGHAIKSIKDCYATGSVTGHDRAGGLVGITDDRISNCYAMGSVTGHDRAGGLVGVADAQIENCYATGNVYGEPVDIVIANLVGVENVRIINCYATGSATKADNETTFRSHNYFVSNGKVVAFDPGMTTLQVGLNSDADSQITVDTNLDFNLSIADLTSDSSLISVKSFLNQLSQKATELGAAQNRLESALESNLVQMDNLTSSLSTVRDADIGKVSSEYIKQQILQQAAATLMSTANQSPSIALQLL